MSNNIKVLHTLYSNGCIRNPNMDLIAFYDFETNKLVINGINREFDCVDDSHAMDTVALLTKGE